MRDHEDTEIGRATAPGAQANTKAPERATVEAPARSSTEIRGDAGRTATCVPPERASLAPPSDETTGAPASGQAKLAAPERARSVPPAEDPGPAGRDGAILDSRESAKRRAPHHDSSVVDPDDGGEAVQHFGARKGHSLGDRFADNRFTDPLVMDIVDEWRLRQRVVEAQRKLTLQAKALCRHLAAGDKAVADRIHDRVVATYKEMKKELRGPEDARHPYTDLFVIDDDCQALAPYLEAQDPLVARRKRHEKTLAALGKDLPIAHLADEIRGVNSTTLATIVGELGDLSAYHKGIAGIWKRAGLAVIDGERQRLKPGDAALLHAYSPARRSVFWNIGSALIKAQRGDDRYRQVYLARKDHELARGLPQGHAHNRAMRYMTKALLRDCHKAWCRADGASA